VNDPAGNQWSVAIVSSRESVDVLRSSLAAVLNALRAVPTTIDVLVNGNRQLALQMATVIPELHPGSSCPVSIRLWHIAVADKAHAWNEYVHRIWPQTGIAYFVDGYAQVAPDSLSLLSEGLDNNPHALAISGVPTIGRTAKALGRQMVQEGGGHGTLHALRGEVCLQLRQRRFRIPLGLYRVDGLIFALIAFALDPATHPWDTSRTAVHSRVTWNFRPLAWWSLRDLQTYCKRLLRQAQGDLENRAIREHLAVQKRSPESLPETCSELVLSWRHTFPSDFLKMILRNPLRLVAFRKLCRPRDWSQAKLAPELLLETTLVREDVQAVAFASKAAQISTGTGHSQEP
jgi:hypothetical protein